jgi:integrase/recombinase XerC
MTETVRLSIADAVDQFFADLRLSPRTKKTYRTAISRFLQFVESRHEIVINRASVLDLSEDHVTEFIASVMPDDIRAPEEVSQMRTAQTQLAAIRKLYSYLSSYDLHPDLSTEKLRTRIQAMMPRFSPPPPDVRTGDLDRIVEHVMNLPRERNLTRELRRRKIQAMILFLYRTGVRVSELCGLRRRDIDLESGTANIYRAKGGKSRTVHFDAATAEALVAYWTARKDFGRTVGSYPAFSGRDRIGEPGNAISPRTVEQIVADLCIASGVENPVTPHSFRHGLATELVRRRVRESTVQTILGHASPATTRIYVHKTAMEVADEYQEAFGEYQRPAGAI